MANRITTLCVDASDPAKVAAFWCDVLGWQITEQDDEGVCIGEPSAAGTALPSLLFLRVPDGPKAGKNRLHLDVNATDRDQAAELERLLELGARPVDIGQGDQTWHVLADPEGNEFCLLSRRVEPLPAAVADGS